MIFIDPSELRDTSNLVKYLTSSVTYKSWPNLEAMTGADVMISPDGLPLPDSERVLGYHIEAGAVLIQVKFGHDLPGSVRDGRLNEALSRMQATGAKPFQCLLLFIGVFGYDNTNEMAVINGQLSYGGPMKWKNIYAALDFWNKGGGCVEYPLSVGNLIPAYFDIHQSHIDRIASGETVKFVIPKAPKFYNVIEPAHDTLRRLGVGRKIILQDDIRRLLCSIPGTRIGEVKANAIFDYMADNDIRLDWGGFISILESEEILKVPGIGKGLLRSINQGLYMTEDERNEK